MCKESQQAQQNITNEGTQAEVGKVAEQSRTGRREAPQCRLEQGTMTVKNTGTRAEEDRKSGRPHQGARETKDRSRCHARRVSG